MSEFPTHIFGAQPPTLTIFWGLFCEMMFLWAVVFSDPFSGANLFPAAVLCSCLNAMLFSVL